MIKTLLIYDKKGKVFFNYTGEESQLPIPSDLPYLTLNIPEGKRLINSEFQVDVTKENHFAILEDSPKMEMQILLEKIEQQERAIFELAEMLMKGNE